MSKPAEVVCKVNTHVMGLDVHKSKIVWCRLDRRGRTAARGSVEATSQAVRDLVRVQIGRKKAHVAFEASTGSLWIFDLLVALLRDSSRVHVAHAKKVRAIANTRRKNDANDAWWLAYLTYEGRLPEVHLPTGAYRELRVLCRHRLFCVQRRTKLAQALHAQLTQVGLALPEGALSRSRSLDAARELVAEVPDYLRAIVAEGLEELDRASRQIARWEQAIGELAEKLPEVGEIERRLPGFGPVLAATVVGEVADLQRFKTPKALACYTGLVPSDLTSLVTRHGSITKEGSATLRWALVQAAVACLRVRRGPGRRVGNWIRIRQKKLKNKKKGHVAGARKLAEALWRLFHLGADFDLRKAFSQAPAKP